MDKRGAIEVMNMEHHKDDWGRRCASLGVIVWREDGELLEISPKMCEILDCSEEQAKARGYWGITAAGQKTGEINQLISGSRHYEKEFVRADGTLCSCRVVVFEKSDVAPGIFGVLAVESGVADEKTSRDVERALRLQNALLLDVAKNPVIDAGEVQHAFAKITEVASVGMNCDRVSVWLYDEERTKITCVDLFERGRAGHSSGVELGAKSFPRYFESLKEDRQIVADDAHSHPATSEFSQVYLAPLGISSMLDAPIRHGGHTVGVLCHEHVGAMRAWSQEEQNFAASLADVCSRALAARDRLRAERALQQANEELEARVKERTVELERALKELWGEMDLARRLQTVLLPENPKLRRGEVAGFSKPAQQVGGDFYDVMTVGDVDWIVIGDVSGHGVQAGLVMMMCQTAIRAVLATKPEANPCEVLIEVNKVLRHNVDRLGESRYASVCVLRWASGEIEHAGQHVELLVYRAAQNEVEVIETLGVYLGVENDISDMVEMQRFQFGVGDRLLLMSDGATEAMRGEEMIGVEAFERALKQYAERPISEALNDIASTLDNCVVTDDVTLVLVRAT